MSSPVLVVAEDATVRSAAELMDRRTVLHLPVVDRAGRLTGLVTYRALLQVLGHGSSAALPVSSIMRRDPVCIGPETETLRALELMRGGHLGCLPVVRGDRPIGIVTERDFIRLSARLLEDWLHA